MVEGTLSGTIFSSMRGSAFEGRNASTLLIVH